MDILSDCRYKHRLKIIFGIYLLLAVISTAATPLMRGPDEPAHTAYVYNLAHFRFPQVAHIETRDPGSLESHEAHQPPLYYMLSAMPYRVAEALTGDFPTAARTTRAVSLIIGLFWIYTVSLLAREFFGKTRRALYATAFAAFIPMSSYLGGVVNNDIMICFTFTWALWIMTGILKGRELTSRTALFLGLALGLAALSKAQGLLLLPLAALIPIFARTDNPTQRRKVLINTMLALLITVLVGGWWFARNAIIYGKPILQTLHNPAATPAELMANPIGAIGAVYYVTSVLFQFFWGPYWIVDIWSIYWPELRAAASRPYLAVTLVGTILGVIGLLISTIRPGKDEGFFRRRTFALYFVAGLLVYISVVYQTIFVDKGVLQQGRLLLPLAGVLGIGMVEGFCRVFRSERVRGKVAAAGTAGLVILSLLFSLAVYCNYAFIEV